MLRIYDKYKEDNRVLLLTHSIDVKRDTVLSLKKYEQNLGVNSTKWHFITGEQNKIFGIAEDYFSIARENPTGYDGVDHSGMLILVDTKRQVRSWCDGTDSKDVINLISDIDKLLVEEFNYLKPNNNDSVIVPTKPITPTKPQVTRSNEKRLALIIGNEQYQNGQNLKNPVNDADLMSETLKNLGFEVIKQTNTNKHIMTESIRKFSKKLPYYNVGLFYYAGHGIQVDGLNYLIPVDAQLNEKSDCKFEAVSVNFIVEEFDKYPNNTNIVILDACRNNPFRSWDRGGDRGFKAIYPSSGTIISFATSEGATASDGVYGKNGLFTKELVKQMKIPQPIESVFKKTRVEVEKQSNNAQSPQEWTKLKGDFWFTR